MTQTGLRLAALLPKQVSRPTPHFRSAHSAALARHSRRHRRARHDRGLPGLRRREYGALMARLPTEEGDGAPSFRPLWMLMPYLWPKGQPELRARVFASIFFLILATSA